MQAECMILISKIQLRKKYIFNLDFTFNNICTTMLGLQ